MTRALLILLALTQLPALAENYYNRTGAYQGRAETDSHGNKRFYDKNGAYQGRMENGRFYDKNGAYRGRKQ